MTQLPAQPSRITVNGAAYTLPEDPRTTLLDALRDSFQITSVKKGCDHGQCGACTVLVGGERVLSCLSLAASCEGAEVLTAEGLGTADTGLHPMQGAFLQNDGFQCGYCTPGQICSAVAVLGELAAGAPSYVTPDLSAQPQPTPDELRERMSGNLCRCGAYPHIINALQEVLAGSAEAAEMQPFQQTQSQEVVQ